MISLINNNNNNNNTNTGTGSDSKSKVLLVTNNLEEVKRCLRGVRSTPPCKFFFGPDRYCRFGNQCRFSHEYNANSRAKLGPASIPCKFFFSAQGCRKGDECRFSHQTTMTLPHQQQLLASIPSVENQILPILANESFTVEQLVSNRYHMFVCDNRGHVIVIPSESLKQLTTHTLSSIQTGKSVFENDEIVQVATASDPFIGVHTLFLSRKGLCYSHGSNAGGQLGLNHTADAVLPIRIDHKYFEGETIVKVSAGNGHSVFVTEEGSVFACGLSEHGQLGLGNLDRQSVPRKIAFQGPEDTSVRIVDAQCGSDHTLCLASDGTVFGFGKTGRGQLGIISKTGRVCVPTAVPIPEKVVQISTKSDHSAFLTETGKVFMCGNNNFGQCSDFGQKTTCSFIISPQRIVANTDRITKVCCCDYSTALVTKNNDIYMFGDNDSQIITSSLSGAGAIRGHHSLYTPTLLDVLKKQTISRDWIIENICTTFTSDGIAILLKPNRNYSIFDALLRQHSNQNFTDLDIISQ